MNNKVGGEGIVPLEASKAMSDKASPWRPTEVEARGGVERKVYVGTWETLCLESNLDESKEMKERGWV